MQIGLGHPGQRPCYDPTLSFHGRYLTFSTKASNLVPGDTNSAFDVFRKDLKTREVIRVSTTSTGGQVQGDSSSPTISGDATKIAFTSSAVLDPSHPPAQREGAGERVAQAYVKDLGAGAITLVSRDAAGNAGDDSSEEPKISADGSTVAFFSRAGDLGGGEPRYYAGQIFVADLRSGKLTALEKLLKLKLPALNFADGYSAPTNGGAKVAFSVGIDTLEDDEVRAKDRTGVFVADLRSAKIVHTVRTRAGQVARGPGDTILTPNGRYLVFSSTNTNLVTGDQNLVGSIYRQDLTTGKIRALDVNRKRGLFNAASAPTAVSANGRTIAFDSKSTHLTGNKDTNGITTDAYLARVP